MHFVLTENYNKNVNNCLLPTPLFLPSFGVYVVEKGACPCGPLLGVRPLFSVLSFFLFHLGKEGETGRSHPLHVNPVNTREWGWPPDVISGSPMYSTFKCPSFLSFIGQSQEMHGVFLKIQQIISVYCFASIFKLRTIEFSLNCF